MRATARLRRLIERIKGQRLASMNVPPPTASLSLLDWSTTYLSSYFTDPPSRFHHWLVTELQALRHLRGQRLNVLSPRGSAKSTWASFVYPLWCALHNTEPYIVLTSDTHQQAEKYLDNLRQEVETNEGLRRDYPAVCRPGRIWRGDRLQLPNGVLIEALGTGTKLRGRRNREHRPSLIVVDDPQNTQHIISPLQRERSWEWLTKDVSNAGDPRTNVVVLGTALHREAIVCRLQTTAGWRSKVWQSLEAWPERMDLWREWEDVLLDWHAEEREARARTFFDAHKTDMERGARVLWPEREDLYALMSLRASVGAGSFGTEKQNDPIDPAACEWPPEYFDRADFWFTDWPPLTVRTLGLDPSKGGDARHGDYSAIVRLGRDKLGVLYVEADLARRNVDQIVQDCVRHCREFAPDAFAVETNQFQQLMVAPMQAAAKAAQVHLPVAEVVNVKDKDLRIRRLTEFLAQRKIRFRARSPGTALLVQQLRDFPHGAHDDGPDATELALRVMIETHNERVKRRGRR